MLCCIIFHTILCLSASHDPLSRFYDLLTGCDLQRGEHCVTGHDDRGFNEQSAV